MKLVRNAGTDRVLDLIRPQLLPGRQLDLLTPTLSLFAFEALYEAACGLDSVRWVLPHDAVDLALLGTVGDRAARNRLQVPRLARLLADWLRNKAELRFAAGTIPQGLAVVRQAGGEPLQAVHGAFGLSTDGLGLTPGNPLSFIQASESPSEAQMLAQWFDAQWTSLASQPEAKSALLNRLSELASPRDPMSIYAAVLFHLFQSDSQGMDEDRIVKSATGIRNTVVWKKLYKFQRDGVVGAIDKLERFGGCIIADSVGLGKTFEYPQSK